MGRATLEKRYGIKIANDDYFDPFSGKCVKQYKVYSADGCLWNYGLATMKAVEEVCRRNRDSLLHIKELAERCEDKEEEKPKYIVWIETEYEETCITTEADEQVAVYSDRFTKTELAELMKKRFGDDVKYEVWTC